MQRLPKDPAGTSRQADYLRRTAAVVNQNNPIGGPGVLVQKTTRGTLIRAKKRPGRRGGGGGTDDLVWL